MAALRLLRARVLASLTASLAASLPVILLVAPASGFPQQSADVNCTADFVCVRVLKGDEVRLVLDNRTIKPLAFQLYLSEGLERWNPPRLLLEQPGSTELARFPRPPLGWGFRYRLHYGHQPFEHDPNAVYRLPYAPGQAWPVTQSVGHISTHHPGNRFALDFAMPVGTPVHAARGGVVVSVYDRSDAHSVTGSASANHIWIRHADGTIGKYLHLDHLGVEVAEGDPVAVGTRIGVSGNTGFSNGPHLHFSVSTLDGQELYRTFDVTFLTRSGPISLRSGRAYHHP